MKAEIVVRMDNAAFEEAPASELGRILAAAIIRIEQGDSDFPLKDINGNTVGSFNIRL